MSEAYVGEIRYFPYTFAPLGWLTCDGNLVSISEYETLYVLIGTTYGGDGERTFGLPDLRGRVPIGFDPQSSAYQLGAVAGSETVTLIANQLPAHSHVVQASTATATAINPTGRVFAANAANAIYTAPSPSTTVAMNGTAIGVAGSSLPHENRAPTLAIRPCIAFQGIYPSQ